VDPEDTITLNGYEVNVNNFDINDVSELLCEAIGIKPGPESAQATKSLEVSKSIWTSWDERVVRETWITEGVSDCPKE